MPLNRNMPADQRILQAFNALAMGSAAAAGQKTYLVSPIRGFVKEVGFVPNSLVASTSTITVSINDPDEAGSSYTQIISSTLGSFSSAVLYEGSCNSVVPISPAFIKQGGTLQCVTSGNLAAIGATVYAIIDPV